MQTTSQLYKNIIADPTHTFDVKLNIAGVDYEQEDILDLITDSKVWQQSPTIGGVYSSTCEFSILSDGASIPRMAKVIPYFRARTESQESEWIKKGEFYIDTRETIENGSGIKIFKAHCFDAILKTNAMYAESSISWPAVDISAINEICTAVGLTQDSRNASILNKGYTVGFPLKQTYRDVLSYIAVMYGANWIITDDGKLRIIPITGNADTIVIGQSVVDLRLSPKRPAYSKVYIAVSNEDAFIKGNSDENVMEAYCPSATQTIANRIYSTLSAWQYQPFEAVGAWTDPSIEVGDKATILSITTPVYSRRISFGSGMVMELSAPNDDYIDHEYSYESPNDRRYKQTVDGLQREIVATATSLSSTIRQVENIQAQVDNAIETFTGAAVPTLNNYPANEWSTDTQKDTHIGDLYVVNSEGGDYEGFYYRFEKVNNAYQWRLLKDSEVTKALAEAEEALRRVGAAETAIEQNAQAITLRATKTEAQQYASTAQTNAINAAASDATSKANQAKTDAVSEANAATDQKLTNYSTTTEMNSAIEVSANAITQTVSETYTTKQEFANLEIGGENLLPDSDAPTLAATYKPNGATANNSRYFSGTKPAAGTYTQEWIPLPNDIPAPPISVKHCAHYVYPNTTTATMQNGVAWRDRYVPIVVGETYTMSAWFYVKSGRVRIQFQYGADTYKVKAYETLSAGDIWVKRSWTFIAESAYINPGETEIKAWTRPYIGYGYLQGVAAEAYVCGFKMEIGNRATAWGPDTDDIIYKMESHETQIEQNSREIALRATKTEAQGYASTAQANAINAASSDATTKANAAESAAKTYADAQITVSADAITSNVSATYETKAAATQKLNTAKNYAETQAADAEAAAISTASADATTKANAAEAGAKGYTDNKLTGYSTTAQMNSAITQSAEAITSTVAATYTTKEDFNNLEIGGENLLPDSDAPTLAATYKPNGATDANSRYFSGKRPAAGTYTMEWIPLPDDIPAPPISSKYCAHYIYPATIANRNGVAWYNRYVPMVVGETYTMSAWFYVKTGNVTVHFQYGADPYKAKPIEIISAGDAWVRYSWTFVAETQYINPGDANSKAWTRPYIGCGSIANTASEAYVTGFQMEIGNRATAWGADPDDVETRVTSAEATLSVQAGQIASKVSETDYNGNTIASLINQNSTTVQISASHVDLQGAVTVSAFDPTTQGLLVKNVTTKNQYAKSASKTTAPAESSSDWQDTIPVYDATKKYIWTRVVSTKTYTNDMSTTTYSVATCDENLAKAIEDAAIAQAEIDSLEIGGTNLLPDSNAPSFTKVSGTVNRYLSDPTQSAYVTGEFVEITNPPVPGIKNGYKLSCIEESTTVSQRGYAWRETETLISLVPGEEYTLSCYVRKLSGNPKINQRYAYLSGSTWKFPVSVSISEGIEVTWTEWQKISWTFTYNPTATTTHPRIYAVQLANYSLGEIETCGFKLEKGNMTTAWSPAPIDSEYAISISVKGADVEYYKSTSPTSLDDGQWQTTTPTWEDGYYIWTRTKWTQNDGSISFSTPSCITGNTGAKGDKGDAGTASTVYYLQSSANAIVKNQAGTLSPASITFSAKSKTGTSNPANYSGRFKISESTNGSSWTAKYTSSSDEASKAYTPSANTVKFIKCDLYLAGGTTTLVDTQTVPVVADGANGTNGTDGKDAYTVILTNENHTFAGSTTAAIASSTVCNIIAYKGATQVAATIGSITGAPTGMTVTPSGSGTTNASFTVAVTTSMTTKNGVLTVPVTVDGKTFNMKFTYSLALKGNDGKGVKTITNYYAVNNSTTAPADSAFSTTVAAPTATDRYLWNYELLTYTDDSTAKTNKHIMAVYGEKGNTGKGISSITEYYAVNNSTTAPADSSFSTTVQTMTESNKYLWNYENVTYTDSTTEKTAKRIIGVYGTHGDTGKGILSVTELYYCSSSSTAPSAPSATVTVNDPTKYNQWNKACPEWTSTYKYYYTCSEVKYTDNTYTWTNVSVNNGYTTANAAASAAQTAADNAQSIAETTAANSPVINLLPIIYERENTSGKQWVNNGITWVVNSDGSVTATGTATETSTYYLSGTSLTSSVPKIRIDPTKKHTFSGCPEGGSGTTYQFRCMFFSGTSASESYVTREDNGAGFTQAAGYYGVVPYFRIYSGYACPEGGITFYPMLEVGDTKHTYVSSRIGTAGLTKNAVKSTVSCYYRSTADTAPTIDTSTTIGTATNTDNTWSYILLNPKKNTYFYTCERYTYMDGSISFSSVRRMGNLSVTAQWCSANDQTLFDGANIYTGSVTADAIAANSIFTQKLTATDFTITGGSIQINTNNSTYDALILNYQGAQGLLTTKIQPGSVQVSSATTSVHLDADGIRFTENNKTTGWIPATGLMFMDIDLTDQDIPPSSSSVMYRQAICDVLNARSAETPVGSFVLLRIKHKTISSDPKYTGQVEYEVWGAQKGSNADKSYHIDSPTGDNPYTMYLNTGKAATLLENPTYYNQIFYVHGAWRTDRTLKVYD